MSPKYSYTENEGKQFASSGDVLVDFFRSAAAMRTQVLEKRDNLGKLFLDAYTQDREVATKLVFWLRDPRRGAGEKASARKLLVLLQEANPKFLVDNLDNVVKYGYWKDILKVANKNKGVIKHWAKKIKSGDRLASKWAPRMHSKYHDVACKLRDDMKLTNKEYRSLIKKNTETVEQKMTSQEWDEIIYESVPSIAMKKYFKIFKKHDEERFEAWMNNKETKANASVLYPHEVLILAMEHGDIDKKMADKLWANLPNFIKEGERFLPIIDVSGSMCSPAGGSKKVQCIHVAIALGMYLAERNESIFKDHFITFSRNPQLVKITGDTLSEKYHNMDQAQWDMNTDFEKAYRLILNLGIKHKIPQSYMPTMLIILSDMQFDSCTNGDVAMINLKKEYTAAGYTIPKLIFWNLDDHGNGSPAQSKNKNVGLVSGFSPSLMEAILECKTFKPIDLVMKTVEKYDDINMKHLPTVEDIEKAQDKINDLIGKNKYDFTKYL